jgi:hypothetical protein
MRHLEDKYLGRYIPIDCLPRYNLARLHAWQWYIDELTPGLDRWAFEGFPVAMCNLICFGCII